MANQTGRLFPGKLTTHESFLLGGPSEDAHSNIYFWKPDMCLISFSGQ